MYFSIYLIYMFIYILYIQLCDYNYRIYIYIYQSKTRRTMELIDYFRVTNKGLTPMSQLPKQTYITKGYFGISLGMQIIYMLMFVIMFAMTIYRSVKKIKNPRFKSESQKEKMQELERMNQQTGDKETDNNLIYRFDEQDHEKQKKGQGDDDEANTEELDEDSEGEYQRQHDENQEKFIDIDANVMFFQPFLIGNVICVCMFSSDFISIISLILSILLFVVFTVKGACQNIKILSMAFMVPSLLGFLPFFINDHDMTT